MHGITFCLNYTLQTIEFPVERDSDMQPESEVQACKILLEEGPLLTHSLQQVPKCRMLRVLGDLKLVAENARKPQALFRNLACGSVLSGINVQSLILLQCSGRPGPVASMLLGIYPILLELSGRCERCRHGEVEKHNKLAICPLCEDQ